MYGGVEVRLHACGERMGFNNIGVGYRDAAVSSGRLKMAPV